MHFNGSFAYAVVVFLIWCFGRGISCLKNVRIVAADAVKSGDSLRLVCNYDLETAQLYSIKWYFNLDEFYRFVPKESPPTRVFPREGITVDMSQSDNQSVTLRAVQRRLTGFYKCEVTADAPSFHTVIEKVVVVVTEPPEAPPFLATEKVKYSEGDRIKANCTSHRSFPAANLTWFINDQKVTDKNLNILKRSTLPVSADKEGLETSRSSLELLATSDIFSKGKLTLACEATQFSLYKKRNELNLLEDVPQLAHVLSPARSRSYSDKANKIFHWLTLCFILGSSYLKR